MTLNRDWNDYSDNEILPTLPTTWSLSQNKQELFTTVDMPPLILKKQIFTTSEMPPLILKKQIFTTSEMSPLILKKQIFTTAEIPKNVSKKGSNSFTVLNVDTESDSLSDSE